MLKCSINGNYYAVSKKHLQGYISEYSFRYDNDRRKDEESMFWSVLKQVYDYRFS
jgi:hypothetical protein